MVRAARVLVFAMAAALVVAPLSAAVYTITLKSGLTFESRAEPEDASWDAGKVVFLDELGNLISLAKADIDTIQSDFESKGYGHMLDNTTMALGWAPNDAVEGVVGSDTAAAAAGGMGTQAPWTVEQGVDTERTTETSGIPGAWVGVPGVQPVPGTPGYVAPQVLTAPTPAPAPQPAPAAPAPESGGDFGSPEAPVGE
jgi:hypothetical protein